MIILPTLLLVNEWFYNAKWASDLFLGIRGRCDFNQIGHLIEALSIILKNISYTTLKCSDISKALHQLLLLGQKNINFTHNFIAWQKGPSWSWSYGSWIYNYLYNQCQSLLKLWVWTLFMTRCTWYNIMWSSLSVTCGRSVVFFGYSDFLHQ